MREILFRGKMVYEMPSPISEWVYGYLSFVYIDNPAKASIYCPKVAQRYDVLFETIGQYTGLLDKNGTKIFEGDIVKWGHLPHSYEKPIRIAAVEFNPDIQYRTVTMRDPNTHRDYYFKQGCFAYAETQFYLEVIGNIHDNPELLEVEK